MLSQIKPICTVRVRRRFSGGGGGGDCVGGV